MGPHGDPFEQALVVSKVSFVPQNTHEISKMSASVRIVVLALVFAAGCVMRVHRLTLPPRDGYGNGMGVRGGCPEPHLQTQNPTGRSTGTPLADLFS